MIFSNVILLIEFIVKFLSNFFSITYYQCLEYVIIAQCNQSFLLILALKSKTCVTTIPILTWLKFNLNLIPIPLPNILSMGSWLGIGTSTIEGASMWLHKSPKQVLHFHPKLYHTWKEGEKVHLWSSNHLSNIPNHRSQHIHPCAPRWKKEGREGDHVNNDASIHNPHSSKHRKKRRRKEMYFDSSTQQVSQPCKKYSTIGRKARRKVCDTQIIHPISTIIHAFTSIHVAPSPF
jgi:hypothetical protein